VDALTAGCHLVNLGPAVLVAAAQRAVVPEQQQAAGQLPPHQHTVVQRSQRLAVLVINTGAQVQQGLEHKQWKQWKKIKAKKRLFCACETFLCLGVYTFL